MFGLCKNFCMLYSNAIIEEVNVASALTDVSMVLFTVAVVSYAYLCVKEFIIECKNVITD